MAFLGGLVEKEAPPETTQRRVVKSSAKSIFAIVAAGVGLMCDGYQNNLMTATNVLFKQEYFDDKGDPVYNGTLSTRVSNSLLVGEIIGMLAMGLICDFMGRKKSMIFTSVLMIVGGILATAAHGKTTTGMFWMIIVFRGVIGFATGGEYPVASAAASEGANESVKRRGGAFILVTNLPLALGGPFCIVVFLIVWEAASGYAHLSTIWRVCFGIGCIWPVFILLFRLKMAASKMFTDSRFMNWNIPWHLVVRFYWRRLLGTCGGWFLYDFITFPNGIFSATIISSLVSKQVPNPYDNNNMVNDIKTTMEWQLLLGAIAIPGVFVGAFLADRIGRKWTMLIGFGGYLIFGLIVGCSFDKMKKIVPLFVVFYGLFQSCGNLGPGDIVGLASSESYATPVRGTLYGLSAAFGKAGGAVGTQAFKPIQNNIGKEWTFIIAALCGLAGMIVTFLFIPHLRDDDLALEDVRFKKFMVERGYGHLFPEITDVEELYSSDAASRSPELEPKKNATERVDELSA